MPLTLYLASSSPRRETLLRQLQLSFEIIRPEIDESQKKNETAEVYVMRLAKEKSLAGVSLASLDLPVLGADTIVVLDEAILGKPTTTEQAFDMLCALSGRWHRVITAIAISDSTLSLCKRIITEVHFADLTTDEIHSYLQTGEAFDKAGAYGIQGYAGTFVKEIRGSYHNVVGLPLVETKVLLQEFQAKKK